MTITWYALVNGGGSGMLEGADPEDIPEMLAMLNERKRQRELGHTLDHGDGMKRAGYHLPQAEVFKVMVRDAEREGCLTFPLVLCEEVAEALEETDPAKLRAELAQVAAVALRWAGCVRRRP